MGLDDDTSERILHETIVLGDLTVRDLRQPADEPGYAIGSCVIAGTMFHVEALRVKRDEDGCQVGWNDPHDRTSTSARSTSTPSRRSRSRGSRASGSSGYGRSAIEIAQLGLPAEVEAGEMTRHDAIVVRIGLQAEPIPRVRVTLRCLLDLRRASDDEVLEVMAVPRRRYRPRHADDERPTCCLAAGHERDLGAGPTLGDPDAAAHSSPPT